MRRATAGGPLLIDADPGVDDALALLMACNDQRHRIIGLTVVAGRASLHHTVRNALVLREAVGREDIPVFAGCASPLLHPAPEVDPPYGHDGFGDVRYPNPIDGAQAEHAALAILRLSHQYAGELRVLTLGPLTNLALALKLDPSLPKRIRRCVVMGGAAVHRNVEAVAEFNIRFDPEAAQIVFAAFPCIDLVDRVTAAMHGLPVDKIERWLQTDTPCAKFYERISRKARSVWSNGDGLAVAASALAMAWTLEPLGALDMARRPLTVQLKGCSSRGITAVDWQRQQGRPSNVAILISYQQRRLEHLVERALTASLDAAPLPGIGASARPE